MFYKVIGRGGDVLRLPHSPLVTTDSKITMFVICRTVAKNETYLNMICAQVSAIIVAACTMHINSNIVVASARGWEFKVFQ